MDGSLIANSTDQKTSPSCYFVVKAGIALKAKSPALLAQGLPFAKKKLDSVSQRDSVLRLQIAQPAHVLTQGLVLGHQHCRSQLQ